MKRERITDIDAFAKGTKPPASPNVSAVEMPKAPPSMAEIVELTDKKKQPNPCTTILLEPLTPRDEGKEQKPPGSDSSIRLLELLLLAVHCPQLLWMWETLRSKKRPGEQSLKEIAVASCKIAKPSENEVMYPGGFIVGSLPVYGHRGTGNHA